MTYGLDGVCVAVSDCLVSELAIQRLLLLTIFIRDWPLLSFARKTFEARWPWKTEIFIDTLLTPEFPNSTASGRRSDHSVQYRVLLYIIDSLEEQQRNSEKFFDRMSGRSGLPLAKHC